MKKTKRLFSLSGSPLPVAALIALAPTILCALMQSNMVDWAKGLYENHFPFQPLIYLTGVSLVFMTNVAYERYWESCSKVTVMSSRWGIAAAKAVSFDEFHCKSNRRSQEDTMHLVSLMHALVLQYLRRDDDLLKLCDAGRFNRRTARSRKFSSLPVLGGISDSELEKLRNTSMRVFLVYTWLLRHLNSRCAGEEMAVEPPVLASMYSSFSEGFDDYRQAAKIEEIPFPFIYAQFVGFLVLIFLLLFPLVAVPLTEGWLPLLLAFLTSVAFSGIHITARYLQDPFVAPQPNDLPGVAMQLSFNARLMAASNGAKPGMDSAEPAKSCAVSVDRQH